MQESAKAIPEPNFFQCPNIIIDEYLKELSGSELKCFLFIVRKTKGWHKDVDAISISQFEEYTGLSNRAVIDACNSLVSRGFIFQDIGQRGIKLFTLDCKKFTCEKSSPVKKAHSTHEKSSQVLMKKVHGSPVKKVHTQNTLSKETIQKKLSKESISAAAPKNTKIGLKDLLVLGVERQTASDWLEVRRLKRAALTQTVINLLIKESAKAGISINDAVRVCAENSWQGFKADWYFNLNKQANKKEPISKHGGFGQRDYNQGINEDGSF